jgi:hypothetical protein
MTLSLITAKAALALTLAAATGGGGFGCVSGSIPSASHIASAESAIRNARDLGAERIPDASVHLELAQRQLARAMSDIDRGDAHEARWMVVRADADAHLALALTREARTREAADEMAARVHDLASNTHACCGEPQ